MFAKKDKIVELGKIVRRSLKTNDKRGHLHPMDTRNPHTMS